jgi:hypothetical protein
MKDQSSRRPWRVRWTPTAFAVAAAVATAVVPATAAAAHPAAASDLGNNVIVFDPSMPTADIQARLDAIAGQQLTNQFGEQRYAVLFKPGVYGVDKPLNFQVGYYTEVAGLGMSPDDVTINGSADVYDQCAQSITGGDCNALDNFWRSMSNLHIAVDNPGYCTNTEFWAVSQAAPMRRVHVTGGSANQISLMDYCGDGTFGGSHNASGGFIADSSFSGAVVNGSQQQFYTRNSTMGSWSNGVWNQVFSGDVGAPPQSFPSPPYTTLATTPVSREKPYLTVDAADHYSVVVPAAKTNSAGTDWSTPGAGARTVPLSEFFVAKPSDSVAKINAALAQGRNLLLTPGVYRTTRSIDIKRADTIVLGLGLATLEPDAGNIAMTTADVPGIDISGLVIDAGPRNSPVLLQLGSSHPGRRAGNPHATGAADPTALQDVFFRIGGAHLGRATTSLIVNSDHAVLDDIWAWRADHGTGVGWTQNTADNGVIVTGDDVTATGLFAEHYQKYNALWAGERGRTVFFQNEMPYDAPNQAAWSHNGEPGYPGYTVANFVATHEAWGLGSYIYTPVNPALHSANGFEVPTTAGVKMHDMVTVSLNHAGTIDHVIDGIGAPASPDHSGVPSDVVTYPAP